MAVFRVARTGDYTVMSNYHLRDKRLSLKAKGLLSQMLSLPDDWDYTLSGLCAINLESKDAIRTAIVELERLGYIQRRQTVTESGRFAGNEYTIYERPQSEPLSENTTPAAMPKASPPSKLEPRTPPAPTPTPASAPTPPEAPLTPQEIAQYRALILENIEYDQLREQYPEAAVGDELEELVELMVDTVCARRRTTRLGGAEYPHEAVRSRMLKLNRDHLEYVLDSLHRNTTQIRNIRQYLLTALYNAPVTIRSAYAAQVNHDLWGNGKTG